MGVDYKTIQPQVLVDKICSDETLEQVQECLAAVVDSAHGTGHKVLYDSAYAIAGKTGTTQNNSDGWFMGLTPELVSGCWVGGEDRSVHFDSMEQGQGATLALPIWGLYMKKVYADKTLKITKDDFERPAHKIDLELDCTKYDKEEQEEEYYDPEIQ